MYSASTVHLLHLQGFLIVADGAEKKSRKSGDDALLALALSKDNTVLPWVIQGSANGLAGS